MAAASMLLQAAQLIDMDSDRGSDSDSSDQGRPKVNPRTNRSKPYQRPPGRTPESHNDVERRRRAYLASRFRLLQENVPTVNGARASNVTILQEAVKHIKQLQDEERRLLEAKRQLQAEQQHLVSAVNGEGLTQQSHPVSQGEKSTQNELHGLDDATQAVMFSSCSKRNLMTPPAMTTGSSSDEDSRSDAHSPFAQMSEDAASEFGTAYSPIGLLLLVDAMTAVEKQTVRKPGAISPKMQNQHHPALFSVPQSVAMEA